MDPMLNAIYSTVITMTTVGYGDMAPATAPGRFVAMLIALSGSVVSSVFIITVTDLLDLSFVERKALDHINISHQAAKTI
jgi:voltage-gated potassium channel